MSNLSDYIDALRSAKEAEQQEFETQVQTLIESILTEINTALDGAPVADKVAIDTANFDLVETAIFATGYHLIVSVKPKAEITKKLIRLITRGQVYTVDNESYKIGVKTSSNDSVASITITQDSSWT